MGELSGKGEKLREARESKLFLKFFLKSRGKSVLRDNLVHM